MFNNVPMSLTLFPKMLLQFRDCHVSMKRVASAPSACFFLFSIFETYVRVKRGSLVRIGRKGLSLTHRGNMGQVVEIVAKLLPFHAVEKVWAASLTVQVEVPQS